MFAKKFVLSTAGAVSLILAGLPIAQADAIAENTAECGELYVSIDWDGLYSSKDCGQSWADLDIPTSENVISMLKVGDVLYAGIEREGKVFAYRDGNWTQVGTAMPEGGHVRDLIEVDGVLYAGTNQGVYSCTLGGECWKKIGWLNPAGVINTVLSLLEVDGTIYAGTNNKGVRSYNLEEDTWDTVGTTLPGDYAADLLEVDGEMFALTTVYGVYSHKNGGDWTKVGENTPEGRAFRFIEVDGALYTATADARGVYANTANNNWVAVGTNMPGNGDIADLGAINGVIYAGNHHEGVWTYSLTNNANSSWTAPASKPWTGYIVKLLAVETAQ